MKRYVSNGRQLSMLIHESMHGLLHVDTETLVFDSEIGACRKYH